MLNIYFLFFQYLRPLINNIKPKIVPNHKEAILVIIVIAELTDILILYKVLIDATNNPSITPIPPGTVDIIPNNCDVV